MSDAKIVLQLSALKQNSQGLGQSLVHVKQKAAMLTNTQDTKVSAMLRTVLGLL